MARKPTYATKRELADHKKEVVRLIREAKKMDIKQDKAMMKKKKEEKKSKEKGKSKKY